MADSKMTDKRCSPLLHIAVFSAFAATAGASYGVDWRMMIASTDVVIMVDAETFKRADQQLTFRAALFLPKPQKNGSIGNFANMTFDCTGRRARSEQTLDIKPDTSTSPATDEKPGFAPVTPGSLGDLFLGHMCDSKREGNKINGVLVFAPPQMAAKTVFSLLKLGLDSNQASSLAARQYFDEKSLLNQLENVGIPEKKRIAARKVLAAQTILPPPPPPPIVPLDSAVATGKVGKYTHSAHELIGGLWLRADGTFRYGLTVGSLDETAAGRWTAKGSRVLLVNEPRVVPPTITLGTEKFEPGVPFSLALVTSSGSAVAGVDFSIEFGNGPPLESYTQNARWLLPADEKRQPRLITFSWPSYGVRPTPFAINAQVANAVSYVFTPNNFGVLDMTGLVVDADKEGLTLYRDGNAMRFRKNN